MGQIDPLAAADAMPKIALQISFKALIIHYFMIF